MAMQIHGKRSEQNKRKLTNERRKSQKREITEVAKARDSRAVLWKISIKISQKLLANGIERPKTLILTNERIAKLPDLPNGQKSNNLTLKGGGGGGMK